jgi:hypothetical protein
MDHDTRTVNEILKDQEEPELTEADIQQEVPVADLGREALTDEQIAKAQKKAKKLMDKYQHIMGEALTLVVARQLYNTTLYALGRDLEALKVKQQDGVLAVIVDSMSEMAMKAFRRDKLVEGLQKFGLPLAMTELHREEREMAEADAAAKAVEDKGRSSSEIPIGFSLDLGGPTTMSRDRSVILVGPVKLVEGLLLRASHHALLKKEEGPSSPRVVTVHCASRMKVATDKAQDRTILTLGASSWTACAENPTAMGHYMTKILRRTYKNRCDLLLVDDLCASQRAPMVGMPTDAHAASAHRAIRRWADEAKSAVLVGLPLKELPENYNSHGWQQLEVHSEVRIAMTRSVEGDDSKVAVCLYNPWKGPQSAHALFTISKELVT